MRDAKHERVVSHLDNRENSKEAMRSLLRFAQVKLESGVSGGLPLDEVAKAKEYFYMWKKRKPFENNGLIFGTSAFLALIFSFTSRIGLGWGIGIVLASWGLFAFLEFEKTKRLYIREMIGDMSNFSQKDRLLYLTGLREELWNIKEEYFRAKLFGITLFLMLISFLFMSYYVANFEVRLICFFVSLVSIMSYFSGGAIKVVRKI